jgi:hypothetical protein
MRNRRVKKQIWLNDDEAYLLKEKSDRVGMNASNYIRHLIVGYKPKEKPPEEFYDNFKEIRRIGKNINQIARLASSTGKVDMLYFTKQTDMLNDFIIEIKDKYLRPKKEE